MDPQKMPWDENWSAPQPAGPTSITMPINDPIKSMSVPRAQNDLTQQQQQIQQNAVRAPYLAGTAADDAAIKHTQAVKAQQDADDAEAARQAGAMSASGNIHGPEYMQRFVPADAQPIVRAMLEGNLPVGARSLTSPQMLPYLKYAINVDPNFSAANYPTRASFRQGLTEGKEGISIDALNTAMAHAHTIAGTLGALNNKSGFLGTTVDNPLGNWWSQRQGDQTVPVLSSQLSKYGDEKSRVYVGGSGGQAERAQADKELPINGSPEQQFGVLRSDVEFYKGKLQALDAKGKRILGPTFDINSTLSPQARAAMQFFDGLNPVGIKADGSHPGDAGPPAGLAPFGATGGGGLPPTPGGSPSGGGPGPSVPPGGSPGGDQYNIATGASRTVNDPRGNKIIDNMLRTGASDDQINAALSAIGVPNVDPGDSAKARAYLKANPGFKGSFGAATREVPTTRWNQFTASPAGTAAFATVDGLTGGYSDEMTSLLGGGDLADLNARKQALFATNPKSALLGQTAGAIGAMAGIGAAGRATGLAARLGEFVPKINLLGDVGFGALSGAGQNNDDRSAGAFAGAVGGLVGHGLGVAGSKVVGAAARTPVGTAITNRVGGMFGGGGLTSATAPGAGDRLILDATNRAGVDNVTSALSEAHGLNVPMSMADTNPNLRELTGAAVRRSPTASSLAEDTMLPRGRGQYDRFTSAVQRDLGPTTNISQQSADLVTQAKAAAAARYPQAYATPVPSTPELDSVLNTPFGRQALGRAKTIAANERRDPAELGFAQDADGNTVLNPQPNAAIAGHLDARAELDAAQNAYRTARNTPGSNMTQATNRVEKARQTLRQAQAAINAAPSPSTAASVPAYTQQTLDYVKRGMDDVLEQQRNPVTGRLQLDEAGRAQAGVRGSLLSENDRLNPGFADARAAYAGPMASRDALNRGVDAYGLHPDELGIQVGNQSPEHLGQMQLGYRGALVDHAGRIRDSGNPWDATLGSPIARDRLGTMYPNNPGVPNLLRQSDLEKQVAQTTNAVLGNSRTARNQIADQAFATNPLVEGAVHAGAAMASHGASVPGSAARMALTFLKDRRTLGVGQRAVDKADAIAPTLLNADPKAALDSLQEMLARDQAWQTFVSQTTPKRIGGMFGGGLGGQAGIASQRR